MIITAQIEGATHSFNTEDESQTIGEGGEAVVMKWTPSQEFMRRHGNRRYAVKLFLEDKPEQREAAEVRQTKLRHIPRGLPAGAITPLTLATDPRSGRIIGYAMPLVEDATPLIKFMDAKFRKNRRLTPAHMIPILIRLYHVVRGLHDRGVIIGDFNPNNQLVTSDGVFVIDVDSASWGQWPCMAATPEYSDPRHLDQSRALNRPYTQESDWYSFTAIAYQLLTGSHPYRDGVHKPGQGKPRKRFPERVTLRLSVFDDSVKLDRHNVHGPASLPEALGQLMREVFTADRRVSPFPIQLLESFQWMVCPSCSHQHGRSTCPSCKAPGVSTPRTVRPIASPPSTPQGTGGRVPSSPDTTYLTASSSNGKLRYVCYRNGAYQREDGSVVWRREFTSDLSALVAGDRTVFCSGPSFAVFNGSVPNHSLPTSVRYGKATVAANSRHVYWVDRDSLLRDDPSGKVTIGTITPHLTSVWVGEKFGLAMMQAGYSTKVSVFDAEKPGLHHSRYLPVTIGKVVGAHCVISDDLAWLRLTIATKSGTVHKCFVLDSAAQLRATTEAGSGQHTWLNGITSSALAVQAKLLIPMATIGIIRLGLEGGSIRQEGVYRGGARSITDQGDVGVHLNGTTLVYVGRKSISPVTT